MCGLVLLSDGSSFGMYEQERSVFWGMMLLNSLRGLHSTGIAGGMKDDLEKIDIFKVMGDPFNLMKQKDGNLFWSRLQGKYCFAIGHGRYATTGKINIKNAHPFRNGDIVLAHNGTLRNMYQIRQEAEKITNNAKFMNVDSELLTVLFSVNEPKEVFKIIEGAYAIVYYNTSTKKIYFVRNCERPLHILKDTKKRIILLASEQATLEWARVKYHLMDDIKMLSPNVLYTHEPKTMNIEEEEIPTQSIMTTYNDFADHYSDSANYNDYGSKSMTKAWTSDTYMKRNAFITKYYIGKVIEFKARTYEDVYQGSKSMLIGDLKDDPNIEVRGAYEGEILDIFDHDILYGKINNVFPDLNDDNGRIYCKDITFIKPIHLLPSAPLNSPSCLLTSHGEMITLYNKEKLTKWKFELAITEGCTLCGDVIIPEQAQFITIKDDTVKCPDCTINEKFVD